MIKLIKKKELEDLKNSLKIKLDEGDCENLDDLLEAQGELSKSNNSYVQKQFEKSKKRLLKEGKLTEQEIINICEIQSELAKLEIGIKGEAEAKIEVSLPKSFF